MYNLNRIFLISCFFLTCISFYLQADIKAQKFVYVTVLYHEEDEARIGEYITCLDKVLQHNSIDTFHVIYDASPKRIGKGSALLDYLKSKKFKITTINSRPSFGYCFNLINKLYPGRKIILSNADIYFNETLKKLEQFDLKKQFLALTRWQVLKDFSIVPYFFPEHPTITLYSQDTWIFKAPICKFEKDDYLIGMPACDSNVAHYAKRAGLKVSNPCLTIQCCHLHLTSIRHYPKISVPLPKGYIPETWSKLPIGVN